jgi:hypothetical protein
LAEIRPAEKLGQAHDFRTAPGRLARGVEAFGKVALIRSIELELNDREGKRHALKISLQT